MSKEIDYDEAVSMWEEVIEGHRAQTAWDKKHGEDTISRKLREHMEASAARAEEAAKAEHQERADLDACFGRRVSVRSHSTEKLWRAFQEGAGLFALDTGNAGDGDTLICGASGTEEEVWADLLYHHDLTERPEGWTLTRLRPMPSFPS